MTLYPLRPLHTLRAFRYVHFNLHPSENLASAPKSGNFAEVIEDLPPRVGSGAQRGDEKLR